jgi:hypothetical protein
MNDKYVLVTAISTHRMRYAIPMDELQKLNEEHPVDPRWALDCVTMPRDRRVLSRSSW